MPYRNLWLIDMGDGTWHDPDDPKLGEPLWVTSRGVV